MYSTTPLNTHVNTPDYTTNTSDYRIHFCIHAPNPAEYTTDTPRIQARARPDFMKSSGRCLTEER